MIPPKLLFSLVVSITLSACAASKDARNPDDIVDDGKRNSILLSYEIRLDTHDRYPGVNSTELALRCGPVKSLNAYPVCFYIRVPFQGKRDDNGFILNSFETAGAKIFQIKYGEYSLSRSNFSVVVGQRRDRVCYPSKKHRRDRCHEEYVDIKTEYGSNFPTGRVFSIEGGDGCYLGHVTLHMRGSKLVEYNIDTLFTKDSIEQVFAQLPEHLRDKARARINTLCTGADINQHDEGQG